MFRWVAYKGTELAGARALFRGPAHALGSAVIVVVTVLFVLLLAAGRLQSTAPVQALPRRLVSGVAMLMPQGWAFFTKSPRSEVMRVWVRGPDNIWQKRQARYSGGPRSWFGMDREVRTEGLQLAFIQTPLGGKPDLWTSCTMGQTQGCFANAKPIEVLNPSPEPDLCGMVGIEVHPAKPFEWRDLPNNAARNKVATFSVRCTKGGAS